MTDEAVVRAYVGAFLEKMLGELNEGHEKGVEHVFRNLALYLSPPVTALDGGGAPLAQLRDALPPGCAARFDALGLNGARLADGLLARVPYKGASAHDPGRVMVASADFDGPGAPAAQVDYMLARALEATPLAELAVRGDGAARAAAAAGGGPEGASER